MPASILCVDNDRNLCQILVKALSGEGYRVWSAYDGDEALQMVEEAEPDLVLLDVMLPRRDGFEVLEAIREREAASATPVLLISGTSPTPEYTRRARRLGATAFLQKPIPLASLLESVAGALGGMKGLAVEDPARTRSPRRSAAGLNGSFERLPFAALLHHLHGLRATGVLHLASERKRKWLQFREGYPVAVRSNLVNECLGNLLVRSGRVSPREVAESRRRMRDGRLQGEILVGMDLMGEEELSAALRAQAKEKFFEIFTWETGAFRFDLGGRLQRANELPVERSPANLILEGVRSRVPLRQIDAGLGADRRAYLAPAESPFYRFQEVDLDSSEIEMLRRLDGTRRLGELLGADAGLRRTVYALLAAGLLEIRPRAPAGREPAPSPERTPAGSPTRATAEDEEALRAELTATAERLRGLTPSEVLGVGEGSDDGHVREAYERLARRVHPDRASNCSEAVRQLAEEVFAQVVDAYQTLSDPSGRKASWLGPGPPARESEDRAAGSRVLDAELEFQRGDLALRQRHYETALAHFGKALELYPQEGEYHAHYAWALYQCHPGDPSIVGEALEHARRGLKLASHREKPYLLVGRLCKAVGRTEAAEKLFTRAVQIRPDCTEALSELRLIHLRRHRSKGIIRRLFRW